MNTNTKGILVCPSMISADFLRFPQELSEIELAGADCVHWDIMDGNFVNAITFGSNFIAAYRKLSSLRFDVHLMVCNPDKHIQSFIDAGADSVIVHPETCKHLHHTLSLIKNTGKRAGVALNPTTAVEFMEYCMDVIDIVLIMTVNPGSSGQMFIESQLSKIKKIRSMLPDNIEICIDGGINEITSKHCILHGANSLVSGSFLFKSSNYTATIRQLKQIK